MPLLQSLSTTMIFVQLQYPFIHHGPVVDP